MSSSVRTGGSKLSKRDRDLEIMAAMAPVAAQNRAEKRDIEENTFNLLVARLVGGFSMFMALLLFVVCAVLLSIGCCGDHTKYDKGEWDEECRTAADDAAGGDAGQWSCYHRNIYILITFCFGVYLLIVGLTIVIAGQFVWGTERAEARQEQGLDDLAAAVKANHIEQRMAEREETRVLREERAAARAAAADERRERTRAAATAEAERQHASRNPYGGARRYSVGSPATMRAPTVVSNQQRTAPIIVGSTVRRPQSYMVQVGQTQPTYVQSYAQPTRIRISSGDNSPRGRGSNVEIRTTRYVV